MLQTPTRVPENQNSNSTQACGSNNLIQSAAMTSSSNSVLSTPIYVPPNRIGNGVFAPVQQQQTPRQLTNTVTRKDPICTVRVTRADLSETGKPRNTMQHNNTAHIKIYSESEANVTYITTKVREEMGESDLIITMASGLQFFDQEGTRGE